MASVEIDSIAGSIVDAAMRVHTALGPGSFRKCLREVLEA